MVNSEAMGRGSSGVAVGWVGSLDRAPLAEVFRRIAVEERSGDLQVASPSATKTVYFDQGFVVFASSTLKSDRLGESMIEAGRISRGAFVLASSLMKDSKRRFGQALVDAGILPEEELGRHVAAQVNRIVLSLFSLKQGRFNFDEHPCDIPLDLMVSLSIYRILMDGIRRMRRKKLVLDGLPKLDTTLRIAKVPPFTMDFYKLRPEERSVLRFVHEGNSLREIARKVGGNEGVVLRACYALLAAGIVEAATPDAKSLRRVQEETGTFMLSEIRRRIEKKAEDPGVDPIPATPQAAAPGQAPVPSRPAGTATPPELELELYPEQPDGVLELEMEKGSEKTSSVGPTEEQAEQLDATGGEDRQQVIGEGRNLSGLASTAIELFRLKVWEPLCGLARGIHQFFVRESEALETGDGESPPSAEEAPSKRPALKPPSPRIPEPERFAPGMSPGESEPAELDSMPPKKVKSDDWVAEIMGVPSWSMRDDPNDPEMPTAPVHEDASKEEAVPDHLGIPSWSMKDDPNDRLRPSADIHEEEPLKEGLEHSSWSLLDDSLEAEEESHARVDLLQAPVSEDLPEVELELEPTSPSTVSLDSDLFVEGETMGDGQPSILNPIPAEDIELGGESAELEIEFEVDEETFSDLPEQAMGVTGRATPAAGPPIPSPDEKLVPEKKVPSIPDEESEIENAASPGEQSMRAKRPGLGGGEDRLLRDVKLHFQCRDWDGAVRLLEDLVHISPGSAFYRGLLARAMSRHRVLRDNAEKHFIEALRLAPQDAQLHYWLGLYYKSFGLKSRAVNEFRTTLRIDPTHAGARKQFTGGKRSEALGLAIKKFFG